MGMSLYYEAKREQTATEQEWRTCCDIVVRYREQYPFPEKYEDFWIYDRNEEANIVFHGATKLPTDDVDTLFNVANYWLKCLTEITNILPDCVWTVSFEAVPLILDPVEGWRFPSDEEYKLYKEEYKL